VSLPGLSGLLGAKETNFPSFDAVSRGEVTTGTTFNMTMPSGIVAGDLLIAIINNNTGTPGLSNPAAGWTELVDDEDINCGCAIHWKWAVGDENGVAQTFSSTGSMFKSYVCFRVSRAGAPPEASARASGNGGTPNSLGLTPSWGLEKTEWVSIVTDDGGVLPATAPSGYVNIERSATSPTNNAITTARKWAQAASEDPGAWSSKSGNWVAFTMAVKGS
jgi:hypothetical protein